MREDLLGYLLGALDDDERERLERDLRRDPELQRRLEELQERLLFLAEDAETAPAPPGLGERTCDFVAAYEEQRRTRGARARRAAAASPVSPSPRAFRELVGRRSPTSLADIVVGAGIFLAAALLFFPAIARSRYHADLAACQYNLQRLGFALANFSENREGLLPQVPTIGKRAVAGVYAPQLFYGDFLNEARVLICPSSPLATQRTAFRVPTLEEVDAAEGICLIRLQRSMGGSYGYTLGYLDAGCYCHQRHAARPFFAVMADAPSFHLPGHRSSNHGGRGQNVLFEDGHVEFIPGEPQTLFGDSLFLNRYGFAEAGADSQDAVIVASEIAPLLRQP